MSHAAHSGGHPGRPRRSLIEPIRAKTWFWGLAAHMRMPSAYALEMHFSPQRVQRAHGITKRPCKYDKYQRGIHSPSPSLVRAADEEAPGTALYAEHCFWKVAEWPPREIGDIYGYLSTLRPEITDLVFLPSRNDGLARTRRPRSTLATFQALAREADWDALTACIGLIQEAKCLGYEEQYVFYTKPTFTVFRRFAWRQPFVMVAEELFAYLVEHFLDNPDGEMFAKYARDAGLGNLLRLSDYRASLIEDLELLQTHFFTPPPCLHIAESYLHGPVLERALKLRFSGRLDQVARMPEVRNMAKALRRWEAKQPIGPGTAAWTGH